MSGEVIDRQLGRPAVEGGEPVRDRLLLWGEPLIDDADIAEVVDTLRSGWLGAGPRTLELEARFRAFAHVRHAIAVSSCTAGLELALEVLGVGVGDEVITTPMTFSGTANVIVHRGAVPVFADIDSDSRLLDPEDVSRRITPATRAIIPVHLAGRPCDMDCLCTIAREHDLAIVADCAHAIETRYRGRPIAAQADVSVHSFSATKNMTTGEGGMVLTDDPALAKQIRILRNHGLDCDAWERHPSFGFRRYETVSAGYKYSLSDLQASLGLSQMDRLEERLALRERHWQTYREELSDLDAVSLPSEDPDPTNRHARHLFAVLLDLDRLAISRAQFIQALLAEGIAAGVHFSALHLHHFYRERYGFKPGDYPMAEAIGERTLSLPLSAKITDEDVQSVVHAVRKLVAAYAVE
jgi:dTDP-4-amino-4,6-dideoxygalactose transaminase